MDEETIRELEEKLKGKALNENELKHYFKGMAEIGRALGSPEKKPVKAEEDIIRHARKSVVSAKEIGKGQEIVREMLCIKRPGTGIKPGLLEGLIGKRASRDIKADEVISEAMVE